MIEKSLLEGLGANVQFNDGVGVLHCLNSFRSYLK